MLEKKHKGSEICSSTNISAVNGSFTLLYTFLIRSKEQFKFHFVLTGGMPCYVRNHIFIHSFASP